MMLGPPPIKVSSRGFQWVALIVMSVSALGIVTYAGSRFRATYSMQARIETLEIDHKLHKQEYDLLKSALERRLLELERSVFGNPPLTPPKGANPALWQRNRDQELRRRIQTLEYWRLRLDGELERLKREVAHDKNPPK